MRFSLMCFLALLLFVAPAPAQGQTEFDKVLLPISLAGELAGGFGSRWVSSLAVLNRSDEPITIRGVWNGCVITGCGLDAELVAGATINPKPYPIPNHADAQASFLLVEAGRTGDVVAQLRIQDISRQALTWGTEIPVVCEKDGFRGPIQLLDVPIDGRFRNTLRVYDFDPARPRLVIVRFYRMMSHSPIPQDAVPDQLIAELPLLLTAITDFLPGYAQLALDTIAELSEAERIRIEIVPTEDMTFWAFVSVTNNETQHVTLVTP